MTEKSLKLKDIKRLLSDQTSVILSAVDEKLQKTDIKISGVNQKIGMLDIGMAAVEKRIGKLEIKVDERFDQLITTLDKFLKRITDIEDEFTVMKLDLNRMKKVLREKLGVEL